MFLSSKDRRCYSDLNNENYENWWMHAMLRGISYNPVCDGIQTAVKKRMK